MINNIHYNYIVIGKSNQGYTLLNENLIQIIYDAFTPLTQFIDIKKARISTIQYARETDEKYSKRIKIGRSKWNMSDLNTIVTKYKSYPSGNFQFLLLDAEFPSIDSAYKKETTSEAILRIENDNCWGEEYNTKECGLVLSIREDIYEKIGEELVHSFLKNIISLLDKSKVLFKRRVFFTDGLKEISMIDALPSEFSDPERHKELFKGWTKLSL